MTERENPKKSEKLILFSEEEVRNLRKDVNTIINQRNNVKARFDELETNSIGEKKAAISGFGIALLSLISGSLLSYYFCKDSNNVESNHVNNEIIEKVNYDFEGSESIHYDKNNENHEFKIRISENIESCILDYSIDGKDGEEKIIFFDEGIYEKSFNIYDFLNTPAINEPINLEFRLHCFQWDDSVHHKIIINPPSNKLPHLIDNVGSDNYSTNQTNDFMTDPNISIDSVGESILNDQSNNTSSSDSNPTTIKNYATSNLCGNADSSKFMDAINNLVNQGYSENATDYGCLVTKRDTIDGVTVRMADGYSRPAINENLLCKNDGDVNIKCIDKSSSVGDQLVQPKPEGSEIGRDSETPTEYPTDDDNSASDSLYEFLLNDNGWGAL
ncbi:MAG: hypothetical protein ABIG93_05330 [archaeon]